MCARPKSDLMCADVLALLKAVNKISGADGQNDKKERFIKAVDEVIEKMQTIPRFALHIMELNIQLIVSKLQSIMDVIPSTNLNGLIQESIY